ncbi:hypothetical protein BKA67DRAFT_658773 [Truncatella angustata]|uniref:Uncharacterized protein n=1 Tax=Truncatella angustata TaxID=152316 RepID=A0A9P8ULP8_9PEZI|nr:uncharacterized protein BKA67DRAFT_658773 [Truncatella angustata]KAH6654476.1 hypothetical protein BKA67DRAFT_658773 [Truncatella angustata]
MQLIKTLIFLATVTSGAMAAVRQAAVARGGTEQVVAYYDFECDCTTTTTVTVSGGVTVYPTIDSATPPTTISTACTFDNTTPGGYPIPTLATTTVTGVTSTISTVPSGTGSTGVSPPAGGSVPPGATVPPTVTSTRPNPATPTIITGSATHSSSVTLSVSSSSTDTGSGPSTLTPEAPPTSTASSAGAAHQTVYLGLLGAAAFALVI